MGQFVTCVEIATNVNIRTDDLATFRSRVCNFIQARINALAIKEAGAALPDDTFRILWNGDAVAVVRLDVRTQHGKITETHVWCRDDVTDAFGDKFLNTDEELDAQSASGASFFVAGCAA